MPSALLLEANPKFKTIGLFLEDGRQVPFEKIEQYKNIEPKQEANAELNSNQEQRVKFKR